MTQDYQFQVFATKDAGTPVARYNDKDSAIRFCDSYFSPGAGVVTDKAGSVVHRSKEPSTIEAKPAKVKKVKPPTKAQRWSDACSRAIAALEELEEMRSDWEETYGNMPDSLQSSPYGEKLSAMADCDIQSALSTVQEAEALDIPLGFGRD